MLKIRCLIFKRNFYLVTSGFKWTIHIWKLDYECKYSTRYLTDQDHFKAKCQRTEAYSFWKGWWLRHSKWIVSSLEQPNGEMFQKIETLSKCCVLSICYTFLFHLILKTTLQSRYYWPNFTDKGKEIQKTELYVTMEKSDLELRVGFGQLDGKLVQMCVPRLKSDLPYKLLGYTILSSFLSLDELQRNLFCVVFNPHFCCFWIMILSLGCPLHITWYGIGHQYCLKHPCFKCATRGRTWIQMCRPQAKVFWCP